MDAELIFWVVFFVGGYSLALGVLLRIALRKRARDGDASPPQR